MHHLTSGIAPAINGVPYSRGVLSLLDKDALDEKITIVYTSALAGAPSPVQNISQLGFEQFTLDGEAAASFEEAVTFIVANFFKDESGSGGGSGSQVYYVETAGASFTNPDFASKNIVGIFYTDQGFDTTQFTQTGSTFTWTNGLQFVAGALPTFHFGKPVVMPENPWLAIVRSSMEYMGAPTAAEIQAAEELAEDTKGFAHKILAHYMLMGAGQSDKSINIFESGISPASKALTFTNFVADTKGVMLAMPALSGIMNSNVPIFNRKDIYGCGVWFYTPETLGIGDWFICGVGINGTVTSNRLSLHPNSGGGGLDYFQNISSGYTTPALAGAGLNFFWREGNTAYLTCEGASVAIPIDGDYSQDFDAIAQYPNIALVSRSGKNIPVYGWGIFEGLSAAEINAYKAAIIQSLTTLNRM